MNRIITLYDNGNRVNYYSCIVNKKTFDKLTELSTIGGFKRFTMDYEDDTSKKPTVKDVMWDVFFCKVFVTAPKEEFIKYLI